VACPLRDRGAPHTDVVAPTVRSDTGHCAGKRDGSPVEFGLNDMEMVHVRYFLALCEVENFTHAAKLCGVSQPSLSNAIRSLEYELGGSLFERKPRVRLSARGQSVRPHFEAIWREFVEVEGVLRALTVAPARNDRAGSGSSSIEWLGTGW
jgi:DNA-binding transcriptional LysR family regulator